VQLNQHQTIKCKFEHWRKISVLITEYEKEQCMIYEALKYRVVSLCKRTFRAWRLRANLSQNIGKIEHKLTSATIGLSFFMIKEHSENMEIKNFVSSHENHRNTLIKYQTEKIKKKIVGIFKKKYLFTAWKEISLTKRIDFPYNYYNHRLADRSFKAFILALRRRWVHQKNQIICDTVIESRDEKFKAQLFIRLYQNVLKSKKRRYTDTAIYDFRKDFLLTKAFKAFKIVLEEKYRSGQIINYQTSEPTMYQSSNKHEFTNKEMHEYRNRAAPYYTSDEMMNYSNQNMDNSTRRKVNYDVNTILVNEHQIQASPQVPLPHNKVRVLIS
jgi:hypothetical protein